VAKDQEKGRSRSAEFLASRAGKAISGAAFTGASLLALRKIVGLRSLNKPGLEAGKKSLLGMLKNKDIAISAGISGAAGAATSKYDRESYAKHLRAKLLAGDRGLTKTEKDLLRQRMDLRTKPAKRRKKGFSDVYWSPAKWSGVSAGLSGLGAAVGQSSSGKIALKPKAMLPAALVALPTMFGETMMRRTVHGKALASRMNTGKGLLPEERKLVQTIRKLRREKAVNA
jgi:hypothetical protein